MNDIAGIGNKVTQFNTGAVRDIQEDKGRLDLMPLSVVGELYATYRNELCAISKKSETDLIVEIFNNLDNYIYTGDYTVLLRSLCNFIFMSLEWCDYVEYDRLPHAMLDVSLHYKRGLEKYGERNWEKGIPLHSYIDSGTRHFIKWLAHFDDERHDLAFIWNLLCCCHTQQRIDNDSLFDLPFCKVPKASTSSHVDTMNAKLKRLGWTEEHIDESKNR